MSALAGREFQVSLKLGDGSDTVSRLDGLKVTSFEIFGDPIDISDGSSVGWRFLLSGAGRRQVRIAGEGIFLGTLGERDLLHAALLGEARQFTVAMDEGRTLTGTFVAKHLRYSADHDGALNYAISLLSAGAIAIH